MSDENSQPPTPPSPTARRASLSPGQKFSDMFSRSPTGLSGTTNAYPGPIATAAASAQAQQRRRTSISALVTGGSPTSSIFARNRAESSSSNGNGSIDESAIEDGDAPPNSSPNSTFGRRLSFGARALRDARAGTGNNGEGFSWSEQLRSRAERSSSITSPTGAASGSFSRESPRSAPLAAEAPPPPKPAKKERPVPDHFQERILKGDFYMD